MCSTDLIYIGRIRCLSCKELHWKTNVMKTIYGFNTSCELGLKQSQSTPSEHSCKDHHALTGEMHIKIY